MSKVLGIDTGGTYTDAVLMDAGTSRICAKSKTLTTKDNLTLCIDRCLASLPQERFSNIRMVCLSTTLATNAVLEGTGGRVGLLLMGRVPDKEMPTRLYRHINGLLDIRGRILQEIDEAQVRQAAQAFHGLADAVAVSGFAGVRNPIHELRVKELIREHLDVPVVCAHELSASLGFYDRTVTAVINARLIPKISALLTAVQQVLARRGIRAPVMVVKGNGSLIGLDAAMQRPIETILSGPAASIVGGLHLSGAKDALLLDMGGTTTDIACVSDGKVRLDPDGATLGNWKTMVQAAKTVSFDIGGDSHITWRENEGIVIGSRRVRPLCAAGAIYPMLSREIQASAKLDGGELSIEMHAVYYESLCNPAHAAVSNVQKGILKQLESGPKSGTSLVDALGMEGLRPALADMIQRELILPIALTPTDILHAQGTLSLWDAAAARAGVELYAKKLSLDTHSFLERATEAIFGKLCLCCAACTSQLTDLPSPAKIVAIGAPVAAWLPGVCDRLGVKLQIPAHAEVASAIGAAVGEVRVFSKALIRPNKETRQCSVYASDGVHTFADMDTALDWTLSFLRTEVSWRVDLYGGTRAKLVEAIEPKFVHDWEGKPVYIETSIVVEAIANPSAIGPTGSHEETAV